MRGDRPPSLTMTRYAAVRETVKRRVFLTVVVVGLGLLPHLRAPTYGFVNWDDGLFITRNPLFKGPLKEYIWAAVTRPQFEAYHPLHLLSYLPDRLFWPNSPSGFHALNLALFGANILLLYLLALRHSTIAGAIASVLIFAWHPLCVEPVAWISARKDLLAVALSTGVLLVEDGRDSQTSRPSVASLFLFAAAILAKTSVLALPIVLWGWLVWMRGVGRRVAALRAAPYAALAIVPAFVVNRIWTSHSMIVQRPINAPVDALATVATYARRTLWPTDLAAVYPTSMPAASLSAVLLILGAASVLVIWRRLPPAARFAAFAFPAALLPVANIVSIEARFADRYAFLALALLVPPLAVGLTSLLEARRSSRVVAALAVLSVLLWFGWLTWRLSATWRTSRALWTRAAAEQPDVYMAHLNLGGTLAENREWTSAVKEFQTAIRMMPKQSNGYAGLLSVYAGRAEQSGRLPAGTAERWSEEFGRSQYRSDTFDAFIASIPRSSCPECANTLMLMRLRRWPLPDKALTSLARTAIDEGSADAAVIFLDFVQDKQSAEWHELWTSALGALGKVP